MKSRIGPVAFIVLLIGGCNTDIGSSPKDNNLAEERPPTPTPSERVISGYGTDGLIRQGDVRVYDFTDGQQGSILGTGKTDNLGYFETVLTGIDDTIDVQICVESGNYIEEASGTIISVEDGNRLCAVTNYDPNKTFSVVVNPMSHYATGYAECLVGQGESVSNALLKANTALSAIYGFDILRTVPRDVTDENNKGQPYDERMKLGYATAAFSHWTLEAAKADGLSRHTQRYSSLSLHQAVYNDIKSDCALNGKGIAENGSTVISLGMGTTPITTDTYNVEFARSLLSFANSNENKAEIHPQTILGEAERIASSTHVLFGENRLPGSIDEAGPVITVNLNDGDYVSESIQFEISIEDFSGIKTAKIEYLGTEVNLTPEENIVWSLNSTEVLESDGDLTFKITAADLLNNPSEYELTLHVVNSKPIASMSSGKLVNTLDYEFTGKLENYPQGIESISIGDNEVELLDNGELASELTLVQGNNHLVLNVLDSTGRNHLYEWYVKADTEFPTTTFRIPSAASQYRVYHRDMKEDEATLSKLTLQDDANPLYVDVFHTSLGSTLADRETLESQLWPFIDFQIVDNPSGDVSTSIPDLQVSYTYKQGDEIISERTLSSANAMLGEYILPIAEEFLSEDWYQFTGKHQLTINVSDEAGNTTSNEFAFKTYVSVPNATTDVDSNTWTAGNASIKFDSSDFTGVDQVQFVVDGQTVYTTEDLINPEFLIDTSSLESGLHYGHLNAYIDGQLVLSSRIEFNVDNTTAEISFDSPLFINTISYKATGLALDPESGVERVTVNGKQANYNGFEGTFEYTLAFNKGIHTVTAEATNGAGQVSSVTQQVVLDLTAPVNTIITPALVEDYHVYYIAEGEEEPTLAPLKLSSTNDRLYIDGAHSSLNGLDYSRESLRAAEFAYVEILPSDPKNNANAFAGSEDNNLTVRFRYYQGSTVVNDVVLQPVSNDEFSFILPLAEEYLSSGWHEFDGVHRFEFITTDEATNSTTSTFEFKTHVAEPSIHSEYSENTWVSGDYTFEFDTQQVTGIDELRLIINGKTYHPDQINDPKYPVNLSELEAGTHTAMLYGYQNGQQVISKEVKFSVDHTGPTIEIAGKSFSNETMYSLSGTASDPESGISSVKINNSDVQFEKANEFNFSTELQQGKHTISAVAENNAGLSSSTEKNVVIDLTDPKMGVVRPALVETYKVLYRDQFDDEPTFGTLAFNSESKPFYIDPYHVRLNIQSFDRNYLQSESWPYIEILPTDPKNPENGYAGSIDSELTVVYRYFQGDTLKFEKELERVSQTESALVLPIAEEFLTSNWHEYDGTHKIEIIVTDEAGNITSTVFPFKSHAAQPSIESEYDEESWLAGEQVLSFDSTDLTGLDSIRLVINGQTYDPNQIFNPDFSVDLSEFEHGQHSGTIYGYKDGVIVFEHNLKFSVDNTPPIISISGNRWTNNNVYSISGTAIDPESGVVNVTINDSTVDYNEHNGTYSETRTLDQGNYTIIAKAENKSGLVSTAEQQVTVDQTDPVNSVVTPAQIEVYNVYFKSIGTDEPVLASLNFSDQGNPFYIDQFHISLNAQQFTRESLKSKRYPYVEFVPNDPKTLVNNFAGSEDKDLVTTLRYYQGFTLKKQQVIGNTFSNENAIIVPLTNDYLPIGWEQFDGSQRIEFETVDQSGNSSITQFYFKTYYANPTVTSSYSEDTWLSGMQNLSFNTSDITGFESVELVINGNNYTSSTLHDPKFSVNLGAFSSGKHTGVIKAVHNGVRTEIGNVELSVDNSAPVLSITSGSEINASSNGRYTVSGSVSDQESGIQTLTINGSPVSVDSNGTYSSTINLADGVHTITVIAKNKSGLVTTKTKSVTVDTKLPQIGLNYPSSTTPYQILHQNHTGATPTLSTMAFNNSNAYFYYTPETVTMGSIPITVDNCKARLLPFLNYSVFDLPSGAATTDSKDVKVYMSYMQNSSVENGKSRILLSGNLNQYIVPMTIEMLGDGFYLANRDTLHSVKLELEDNVGNTATHIFSFKLSYEPHDVVVSNLQDYNPITSLSSLNSYSNSELKFKSFKISNTNNHPVKVFTDIGSSSYNDTIKHTNGRLTNKYKKYYKDVPRVLTVTQDLGFHPAISGTNINIYKMARCEMKEFESALIWDYNDGNYEPFTSNSTVGSEIKSYSDTPATEYTTPSSPLNEYMTYPMGSLLDPVPTDNRGRLVFIDSDGMRYYPTQLGVLASEHYFYDTVIFGNSTKALRNFFCINADRYLNSGQIQYIDLHSNQTWQRVMIDTTKTIYEIGGMYAGFSYSGSYTKRFFNMVEDITQKARRIQYIQSPGYPKPVISSVSESKSNTIQNKLILTRSNGSTTTLINNNDIYLDPGESLTVTAMSKVPFINSKGWECVFDYNGGTCDESYSWSIDNTLTFDTRYYTDSVNVYRSKISTKVSNSGALTR